MADLENAVRKAARELHDVIAVAHAAGYRVQFPSSVDGLQSLAISETGKVKTPEPPPIPKTFGKRNT